VITLPQRPRQNCTASAAWLTTMLAGLAAICPGCSTVPSGEPAGATGTVLVVPSGMAESLSYITPMDKDEALERGLRDGLEAAASPGGVLVLPLTLAAGAAQGLRGKHPEEVACAEMLLNNAALELDFRRHVCEQLVELGPRLTGHKWALSYASPPSSPDRSCGRDFRDGQLVLLIEVSSLALEPVLESEGIPVNPTLRFRAQVRCRAIDRTTGEEFHEELFRFGGGLHKFLAWAEHDASHLRNQANRGSKVLAGKIIQKLFPPGQRELKRSIQPTHPLGEFCQTPEMYVR
jgi:hypothetical protein